VKPDLAKIAVIAFAALAVAVLSAGVGYRAGRSARPSDGPVPAPGPAPWRMVSVRMVLNADTFDTTASERIRIAGFDADSVPARFRAAARALLALMIEDYTVAVSDAGNGRSVVRYVGHDGRERDVGTMMSALVPVIIACADKSADR